MATIRDVVLVQLNAQELATLSTALRPVGSHVTTDDGVTYVVERLISYDTFLGQRITES